MHCIALKNYILKRNFPGLVFIFIFLPETRGKTPEETAQSFVGLQPLLDRVSLHILLDLF